MSRVVLYTGALGLLGVCLLLVINGPTTALVAIGLCLVLLALAWLGPEAVGTAFVGVAFATAPMYKGLAPAGSPATPTDLALVLGFLLLLPKMVGGTIRLPGLYVVAAVVITVNGFIGAVVSIAPAVALIALVFWIATMFGLPTMIRLWDPPMRTVNAMAWLFVAGHLVSTAYGLLIGGTVGAGRYMGLANHPNYYAESGMIAFALLLHLLATTQKRWLVWPAMAICLYSVVLSGSRAGTLAVAGIIFLIPFVERSAWKGYLLAFAASVTALVFTTRLTDIPLGGSLERLAGGGSAAGSDAVRARGLREGWERFLDHPLTGSGLVDIFEVHNNYLEAAIGVGLLGFIAFLAVLWTLGRPLLGTSPWRRLSYTVAGYAAFGATTPALYDRTFWVAMSLSILAVGAGMRADRSRPDPPPGTEDQPEPTPRTLARRPAPLPVR